MTARITAEKAGDPNIVAFLDMLAWSEGTDNGRQFTKDDGYDVLVGGGNFSGYADHPRKLVKINDKLSSTAAGRYQLLARYYDPYRKLLKLSDFSPVSQDLIAIQQIRERSAIPLIKAGKLSEAIARCANIWASLPGAGYGQHEHKLDNLRAAYVRSGGKLA